VYVGIVVGCLVDRNKNVDIKFSAYDSQDIISLLIKSGYNCSQEMWIHEERFPNRKSSILFLLDVQAAICKALSPPGVLIATEAPAFCKVLTTE
jgi:hypothetical protein